jgi:chromate reductase
VAFVGIGSRWGGLRPVEHLQQVFGYRNGYVFPERVFIANIKDAIEGSKIKDDLLKSLVESQCRNFVRFISGLQSQGLDANSRLKQTEKK